MIDNVAIRFPDRNSTALDESTTQPDETLTERMVKNHYSIKSLTERKIDLNAITKSVESIPDTNWTHGTINIGSNPPQSFILPGDVKQAHNLDVAESIYYTTKTLNSSSGNVKAPVNNKKLNLSDIVKSLKAKLNEEIDRYLCTPVRENNNELYTTDDIMISFDKSSSNENQKLLILRNNVTEPLGTQTIDNKSVIFVCTKFGKPNCSQEQNFSNLIADAFRTHKNNEGVTFNLNEGTNNYNLYNGPQPESESFAGNSEDKYKMDRHQRALEEHMKSNENILRNILFELTRLNDLQWYQYVNNLVPVPDNSGSKLNIYSRSNPINTPSSFAHHPLEGITNMLKFILNMEHYATENGNSKYDPQVKTVLKDLVDKIDREQNNTSKINSNHRVEDLKVINQTWNKSQLDFIIEVMENLIDNKAKTDKSRFMTDNEDIITLRDDEEKNLERQYRLSSEQGPNGLIYKIKKLADYHEYKENTSNQGSDDQEPLESIIKDAEKYRRLNLHNKIKNKNEQTGVEINTNDQQHGKDPLHNRPGEDFLSKIGNIQVN